MRYRSSIKVTGKDIDIHALYKSLLIERKSHKSDRSSYTIKKEDDNILFEITADDAVALRTTFNSITKLLSIFEDIKCLDKK